MNEMLEGQSEDLDQQEVTGWEELTEENKIPGVTWDELADVEMAEATSGGGFDVGKRELGAGEDVGAGESSGMSENANVGEDVGAGGISEKVELDSAAGLETADIQRKVEQLRGWIDLESIAEEQDSEGLAAALQESAERRERVDENKVMLAEKDGRYAEIQDRYDRIPEEVYGAKRALEQYDYEQRRGIFSGVKKALGLGVKKRSALMQEIEDLEAERAQLWRERSDIEESRRELETVLADTDVDGLKREFLEKFETPLSPEEKKEGLDFEALGQLSTEEYLRLWRRLNPFYVTHVTRQGVRDHNAMIYHSAGMGEFHDGMVGVLADDKVLRTPAEVRLVLGRELTEQNVGKALDKMLFQDEVDIEGRRAQGASDQVILDELVEGLPVNTTIAAAEPWADKRAVHFAQLMALDEYYGGESGNEALFVFPTDVIASQCRFGGHMKNNLITAETGAEQKWNDMFVWPQEKDISIDAGLTFLPKSMMVDPETGSKYQTTVIERDGREVRVPEVDEEAIQKFSEWIKTLKEEDEAVQAFTAYGGKRNVNLLRESALEAGVSERILDDLTGLGEDFPYRLLEFLRGGDLSNMMWTIPEEELAAMTPGQRRERSIRDYLEDRSSTWKLAENPVPAEEYWEGYFQRHPEQKPAHIIYYDGSPSRAVRKTLEEAGILSELPVRYDYGRTTQQEITGKGDSHERDGDWLGFEENHVVDEREDEILQGEHRRFNEMARKIIAEHYGLAAE